MTHIVLCGGSGTRLWPLSREKMPKQFLKLFDGKSLFQKTLERNAPICSETIIVTGTEHYFSALDQAQEMKHKGQYILEPTGRNTAPAIALACMMLPKDRIVLVTPSDHLIENGKAYQETVEQAMDLAQMGSLVVFGVVPTSAQTGYGYIEAEGTTVRKFHEKPDEATAKQYIQQSGYYWNAGIFCFRSGAYLDALKQHAPSIYNKTYEAFVSANRDHTILRPTMEAMERIPSDSIDYAVLENADHIAIVKALFGWSDMGSFDALSDVLGGDMSGNTVLSEKYVALVDVDDLIVVDTPDALLVTKKGSSQKVKAVVEKVRKEAPRLAVEHTTGYRPWGNYTVLDEAKGYKIKRIEVKPGRRLSLQKHYHRNEHWVVLSGSATVRVGEKEFVINPNESTYIRAGEVHRLENRGRLPLVIIEVQVGEYTGEDDIIRLEDDYKRLDK